MNVLFVILVSVGLIATVEATVHAFRYAAEQRSRELRRRLQGLGSAGGASTTLLRQGRYATTASLDSLLRDLPLARRVERLLVQADSSSTVAQIFGYSALAAVVGFTFGIVASLGIYLAAAVAIGAGALPFFLLLLARDRRSRNLSEQLPEALDMMSRSLRAGHATIAAFQIVATEMPEPISVEFGRAFEEQRLGLSMERAVVQMTERLPGNGDLKIFAVSTIIQKETGGNLSEILSNIAETIRSRYRFFGKLRALTGEGRASAVVLGALPLVTALAMQFTTPGYLAPLVTSTLGKMVLAYAVASWAVGLIVMYRMTKLDY